MRKMLNFWRDNRTLSTLAVLRRHCIRQKLPERKPLLEFAGMLTEKDADNMLEAIHSNKHNKVVL